MPLPFEVFVYEILQGLLLFAPRIMESLSKEDLEKVIETQRKTIQSLVNEREWLLNDNNILRIRTVQYEEGIHRWQRYTETKELQIQQMVATIQGLRVDLSRAVEELQTVKASYFSLLEKYKLQSQQLDYGINLGKAMYQEWLSYKESYSALLQWVCAGRNAAAGAEAQSANEDLLAASLPVALPCMLDCASGMAPPEVSVHRIVNNEPDLHCPVRLVNGETIFHLLRSPEPPALCRALPSVGKETELPAELTTSLPTECRASDAENQTVEELIETSRVPDTSPGEAIPSFQGNQAKKVRKQN